MKARIYGTPPYQIVTVHAGPGCMGAAAGLSRELSESYGVIEALQTRDTILGQVEELKEQIIANTKEPIVLIGHAWGAILSAILAATYPKLVRKLILVSSLPLRESYLDEIDAKREYHYMEDDLKAYIRVKRALTKMDSENKKEAFIELSRLCKISDEYQPFIIKQDEKDIVAVNGELFYKINRELNELRKSGQLVQYFTYIKCPICVIHGLLDTHPIAGIIEPLLELNVPHQLCLIEESGHTPWRERLGVEDFYRALKYQVESE